MAAYVAVLEHGDRILGMSLAHGGHLTHGHPINFSGRDYEVHSYGVSEVDGRIDYDALERQAREVRPRLLVAGASAYPRIIDFERMARIAHDVEALLFVDMAHIAGLVAAGLHPSPFPHADIVTTTTHKTLRGPRGGLIFGRAELARQIDRAVFPGTQGGPLMHIIAAKAVALREAQLPEFRRLPAPHAGERQGAGRDAAGARCLPRLRRHRQPPRARRRDAPRGDRRAGRAAPRRGGHHRQQERHPVRPAAAQHGFRHPRRIAGHHDARLRAAPRCARWATCSCGPCASATTPRPWRRCPARCATSAPASRCRGCLRRETGGAARSSSLALARRGGSVLPADPGGHAAGRAGREPSTSRTPGGASTVGPSPVPAAWPSRRPSWASARWPCSSSASAVPTGAIPADLHLGRQRHRAATSCSPSSAARSWRRPSASSTTAGRSGRAGSSSSSSSSLAVAIALGVTITSVDQPARIPGRLSCDRPTIEPSSAPARRS